MATAAKAQGQVPLEQRMLLTYAEAAAYLNVSVGTVRRLVADGELMAADVGAVRMRRISRAALEAFVRR